MNRALSVVRSRIGPWALALLTLAALPASAEPRVITTALGHDGRLVSLVQGTYGEMFPDGAEVPSDFAVMALRSTSSAGDEDIQVIPATLDHDYEGVAELVMMGDTGVSFVFWQSWPSPIHSRLRVTSFDGETWTEPIEVASSAFSWRISPSFGVSRGPSRGPVQRTVLHIAWLEEVAGGLWLSKYAPLILDDGKYVGSHPILVLNDFVGGTDGVIRSDLQIPPVLLPGGSGDMMVAALFDQRSERVAALELRFADSELSLLGDAAADEMERNEGSGAASLRSAVRTRLLGDGAHLKPEILNPLVADLDAFLRKRLAEEGSGLATFRDEARVHLIDIGFRLTDGRMQRAVDQARVHLIDIGVRDRESRRHDVRVSVVSDRSLAKPYPGTPEILVSSTGAKLILAWHVENRILYQESRAVGWNEVQEIRLTETLDRDAAMAILQRRVEH